jgi:hypothetical protein
VVSLVVGALEPALHSFTLECGLPLPDWAKASLPPVASAEGDDWTEIVPGGSEEVVGYIQVFMQ